MLRARVFVFKVFLESTRPRKNHPALLCCACRARRARKQKLKAQLEPDSDTGTKTKGCAGDSVATSFFCYTSALVIRFAKSYWQLPPLEI